MIDPRTTFDGLYGLELDDPEALVDEDGAVRGRVAVRDAVRQPFGIVHGGVYASIAEALASVGTYAGVAGDGKAALGMSNNTTFLRPIREGTIHGEARARHRGRTTWVWDVECSDDAGRVCAVSRVTVAVR